MQPRIASLRAFFIPHAIPPMITFDFLLVLLSCVFAHAIGHVLTSVPRLLRNRPLRSAA